MSISDSGKDRVKHNYGGGLVARILRATGRKMVSECKEEGELELSDGRTVTYSTATSTYDAKGRVTLKALIDAAGGDEPLLTRQVGVVIFCFDFTGFSTVTYARAGWNEISLPPPKDNFLFCAMTTNLSNASLQCLAEGIQFPKGGLMFALAHEHGRSLGGDWLAKNPPDRKWKGKSPTSRRILILSIHRYS